MLKIISRKLENSPLESLLKIKGCLKLAKNETQFHMKALKTDLAILFLDRLRNLLRDKFSEAILQLSKEIRGDVNTETYVHGGEEVGLMDLILATEVF